MPINPNIPLQAANSVIDPSNGIASLGNAIKYRQERDIQDQDRAKKNELTDLQIAGEKFKQADAREQQRIKSLVIGSAEVNPLLESGDFDSARSVLQSRKERLDGLGIDSTDTQDALRLLDSDPKILQQYTSNAVNLGTSLGILGDPQSSSSKKVQAAEQMPGGLVRMVYNDGSIEVKRPSENDIASIKEAEDRGVSLQGQRAGARSGATEGQKIATKAFEKMGKIKSNISNLKRVEKLVAEGAETGRIYSLMPSFTQASIELDQLQNELGLDVIGSVTFGALSEGELKLALGTGLPTNLQPEALAQWARDKASAQKKVMSYLNEQVKFLKGGKTVADWLEHKDKKSSSQTDGGDLMSEADKILGL